MLCKILRFDSKFSKFASLFAAGTITAYYQTNFPNEVFLVEEIPFFVMLGMFCGLMGAGFVWLHRRVAIFKKKNRAFRAVFGNSPIAFTALFAMVVGILTYPEGFGRYIAGQYLLIAICVSLYIPAGIFVPSFVIGACGGRICGEILTMWWPDGFRGADGPQIYPGLYAVVGEFLIHML
ncbi:hypothetical protein ANCCAN_24311 [Ancylostoma caninum]|uniref:Chloride transporter, ClC family n=1 Tax=Ancylostoma caninum TaxID=29170 RepID=A0A368FCX5_ANCCA|nr:hypothetical protein ANCCAN_24311 [Ancylostoma caninum]